MLTEKKRFTRKKALTIVAVCTLLLLGALFARWALSQRSMSVKTQEGREKFLLELGWEIDPESEEYRSVLIPEKLDDIMLDYNRMQRAQGYDLCQYAGEKCSQYIYEVTNYPDYSGKVLVTLYVYGSKVIAGDIHTAAVDGFMHSIKRSGE